jgi:predicted dehydrogenase
MADIVNFGILSSAHIHYSHWIEAFGRYPKARALVLWDDDTERGRKNAAEAGIDFEPDLHKLLSRSDIHAVGIAAENNKHAHLTIAAVEAGKHVMCEKPMATTLEDCDQMIDAIDRTGVKYVQIFPMRYDPVNIKIKELLDDGAIGRISAFRKRHSQYYGPLWEENPNWFTDPKLAGGGSFFDEGIHAVDWMRWLFGDPVTVMAQADTVQVKSFEVDDVAVAVFRFASGTFGTIHTSWVEQSAINTSEIFGETGTILQRYTDTSSTRGVSESSIPLSVYTLETRAWELYDMPVHFPLNQEAPIPAFVNCVLNDTEPPVTAQDGREAVKLVLAAYRSAEQGGQPVNVAEEI